MLHAFNQKNVRRILVQRGEEHTNEKNEDGVTSMVFSPLSFMPVEQALDVMLALLGSPLREAIRDRLVVNFNVEFWPSGLRSIGWHGKDDSRCEPDLLIRIDLSSGNPLMLIGEMKWDWRITSDHLAREIDRQTAAISVTEPTADQIVFAVTKIRVTGRVPKVLHLTWLQVSETASQLHRRSPLTPAGRWGHLVSAFLDKAEQTAFQGFHADALPQVGVRSPIFWKDAHG